jgi:hypothetical protein
MIPYEELVAALDRWRIRNGLPVTEADLPPPVEAPRAPLPVDAFAAAPALAPAPARPRTDSEVLALHDADVVADEELYGNDGDDYALQFDSEEPSAGVAAAAPAAAPLYDEDAGQDAAYAEQATYVADDGYGQPADPYAAPADPYAADPYAAPADPYAAPADPYAAPAYGGEEYDASSAIESEEEDEDWSKLPGFPGDGALAEHPPAGDDDDR